jgi:uncharacterized protein (DUF58 family)
MSFASRYLEPALVERLNHLQLSARRVVEGSTTGPHKSPFKGSSIEFRQHRIYVPGDELRRLDWRVLGRTDRPYIKEYDEETNLRCLLMLDCSGSMNYGEGKSCKFDFAARVVSSLAYLMLANTEHVGLAIFRDSLEKWIAPRSGKGQLSYITDAIERTNPGRVADPARSMHRAADRIGRRSLVIIVSDFLSPSAKIREGLMHLGHDRHELILLRVLHRDEVEFPFKSWMQFRGIEGEASRTCDPTMMRQMYLGNFQRHSEALKKDCAAVGAECHDFITDESLVETLTRMLQRRYRLGGR